MKVTVTPRSLLEHFAVIDDPRIDRCKRHSLLDIFAIAICATICGAESFYDFERFGHARQHWLRTFLELPHGIPSHDTFRRVFEMIPPKRFAECFAAWTQSMATLSAGEHVAIDGKTTRGSLERAKGIPALHTVSAWASEHRLVLGQVHSDGHPNEHAAIPELLRMLALNGAIVTIDAAGTYQPIVEQIVDSGGEYLLALKENQPTVYDEAIAAVAEARAQSRSTVVQSYDQQVDKGHGRIEVRRCWVVEGASGRADQWPALRSYVLVESERHINERITCEQRYYLTSLPADAALVNRLVRAHWGIENSLHWVLDVVMAEDANRTRTAHGPKNLALLRKCALNLLRRETSRTDSLKGRLKFAAWDSDYLFKVLTS
jgi:predicted transposase YbfD/YdcC